MDRLFHNFNHQASW